MCNKFSQKVSNDKYDVAEEYMHLRYHGFTKLGLGYFVMLLKKIEMLHSRYNPMDNPRVKMLLFERKNVQCNIH